jgi:hypothetical protein
MDIYLGAGHKNISTFTGKEENLSRNVSPSCPK